MPKTTADTMTAEQQINQILAAIDQITEIDVTTIPLDRIHTVRSSLWAARRTLDGLANKATAHAFSQPIKFPEPHRGPRSGLFVMGSDLESVGGDAA